MKPPNEPKQEDCCNSGCNPCIFDVYEKQLQLYKKFLITGESEKDSENGISDLEYKTFVLISKDLSYSNHVILAFKKLKPGPKVWWSPGAHFLFRYHQSEVTCTRAYTPIILNGAVVTDYDFMVIVKRYDMGLVSSYLYALDVGEHTEWRGPYGIYKIVPNKYTRIVMIAQGTGIAPFFSIINTILDDEDDMTKIYLFFSCHGQSILLREELHFLKAYWNFSYKLFVTEITETMSLKYQEPLVGHKLSYDEFNCIKPLTANDHFLLCGSIQFMQHFKKMLQDNSVQSENIILF